MDPNVSVPAFFAIPRDIKYLICCTAVLSVTGKLRKHSNVRIMTLSVGLPHRWPVNPNLLISVADSAFCSYRAIADATFAVPMQTVVKQRTK